ncbi:MAG: hypothetical protein ACRC4J_00805 [Cetobacterium sp.]
MENPQVGPLQRLAQRIEKILGLNTPVVTQGSQRPRSYYGQSTYLAGGDRKELGLEITEIPIRDYEIARELIEMKTWCPEVDTALEIIASDVFSSEDGDDIGFKIADDLIDETPINPKVVEILTALFDRSIGGRFLEPWLVRMLAYGDAFGAIAFNKQFTQIENLVLLPTWEVFRIEEDDGTLLRFEQRSTLHDRSPIVFHPLTLIHWRYRREHLYGTSITKSIIQDWANLKAKKHDLARACRAVGVNPNVHMMPEGTDEEYKSSYIDDNESRLADGIILNYYLGHGGKVEKLAHNNPDLKALLDAIALIRQIIITKLRIPPYLGGLPAIGARDISGQPAMAYARFIGSVRGALSEGIRQLCDLELALHGIDPRQPENYYRIVFPKIFTTPTTNQGKAEAPEQMEDPEDMNEKESLLDRLKPYANGKIHA